MHTALRPAALAAAIVAIAVAATAQDDAPMAPELQARTTNQLWVVQGYRAGRELADLHEALCAEGAKIVSFLPPHAYVVRSDRRPGAQRNVRNTIPYLPTQRIAPAQVPQVGESPAAFNIVLADKRTDRAPLTQALAALGAEIVNHHDGSLRVEALLNRAQLLEVLHRPEVLWVDRATSRNTDMDHARIQGGAQVLEQVAGYSGQGLIAHSYEALETTHPDFSIAPLFVGATGTPTSHGQAVAGILFGNGSSHPRARGMAPNVQGIVYTDYRPMTPSRYALLGTLANTTGASLTSASWGHSRTGNYSSVSAALDDALFDHDIAYFQSMSDSGQAIARPEAWAKNVISVGSVQHFNNADAADDSAGASGSSRGPAADGRFAPTLVSYGADVWTSDLQGVAGLSPLDHAPNFGGTSAATAIVAGHGLLAMQMFTDGLFGPVRNPGGTRHSNRPHISTLKALLVAGAAQYPFGPLSTDNTRNLQGWGHPNLRSLYEARGRSVIDDHNTALSPGGIATFSINVTSQDPELKVTLAWPEPAANPAAAVTLINDLDLRVIDPSGTCYLGNAGLDASPWSTAGAAGGTATDSINPIECVFVPSPAAGTWTIEVQATNLALDNHPQTPTLDAVFGLVAIAGSSAPPDPESLVVFGKSCGFAGTHPDLTLAGNPRPGGSIQVGYSGLPPAAPGFLLLDSNDLTWSAASASLPTSLAPAAPGCVLYVNPDAPIFITADGIGRGTTTLAVPNALALRGTEYTLQLLFADPRLAGIGVGATPSGRVLLGR